MNISNRFLSTSLRAKILFGVLLSLVPMLVIVSISYFSARNSAIENSQRLMNLVANNGINEINQFIKAQESIFKDWTAEDLFGMAIEFETTKELQDHFKSLLKGQNGFALLVLTDGEGKALIAEAGEQYKGGSDIIKGLKIKEASSIQKGADRSAAFVDHDIMKRIGLKSSHTFLFSFKVKNSEGKANGLLLAYIDWSYFHTSVKSVSARMKENGFANASAAILDPASGVAFSHSVGKKSGNRIELPTLLQSWLQGSDSGEVGIFDIVGENNFVTFFPVEKTSGLFNKSDTGQKETDLLLTVSVPENNIMLAVKKTLWISTGIAGLSAILIILIGLVIVRMIVRPLNRVIGDLTATSDSVASASGQITSSSQVLAEGASEQAATIEETSSSLEEMSSMTKQNADNSSQADGLMQEANQVVGQANDSMSKLTVSMTEISNASEDTSKIIKTIDEIAFQTNLLALNAAVEAARAGEAGAGFAVVADEVRNLAMRAADAARETAQLIEGTVKKINQGGDLVNDTNEAFVRVSKSASKVGELVGEISAASKEQAEGIEQINSAVIEMDKVVQQNAASAEESASSATEMGNQAGSMKHYVGDLVALVGGHRNAQTSKPPKKTSGREKKQVTEHPFEQGKYLEQSKETGPGTRIPLDNEDFQDF